MNFSTVDLTPEQQRFAEEVRSVLDEIVTPEVHEHERVTGDGFNESVHLALGSRGWLFPAWPVEEGGAGLDRVCQRHPRPRAGPPRRPERHDEHHQPGLGGRGAVRRTRAGRRR